MGGIWQKCTVGFWPPETPYIGSFHFDPPVEPKVPRPHLQGPKSQFRYEAISDDYVRQGLARDGRKCRWVVSAVSASLRRPSRGMRPTFPIIALPLNH